MADISNFEEFVTHFIRTLPDSDSNDLQKILEMRSVRRPDQVQIIQLYKQRTEGHEPSGANPATFALLDSLGESSSLKRLEKLVKRKI